MTTTVASILPLTRDSVISAHALIASNIHRTPVLTSKTLSAIATSNLNSNPKSIGQKINLIFKAENLQKIGAFKIRGATHAIARLSDDELRRGVVTHSSGNHAQALALAAREASITRGFPIPAYVVMPAISTPSKIAATKGYGAHVTLCAVSEREAAAKKIQDETGAILIPPYDHPHIILGQGTLALELQEQAAELGMPLDAIVAPCGGGGMLGGIAVACQGTGIRVYGAEPREGADDAARGLKAGKRIELVETLTIADGLRAALGVTNWELVSNKELVKGVFIVGEEEIKSAMGLVIERMKVLIEPSSAVPVATVLGGEEWREVVSGWEGGEGKVWNVGIVLSGGNTTIEKIIDLFGGGK